ncbi:hypothetical protein BGW38_001590, partial [Lunasporangiospora selenospora]
MPSPTLDKDTQGASYRLTPLTGQIVHARRCYRRLCFVDLRIDAATKHTILFRSDDSRSNLDPSLQLTDLQLAVCWKRIRRGDIIKVNVFDATDDERECREQSVFQAVSFDVLRPWPSTSPFSGEPAMGLRNQPPKLAPRQLSRGESSTNKGTASLLTLTETSTKTLPTKAETADATFDASTTITGASFVSNSWKECCKFWINSQRCPTKDCRMKHPVGQELADMRTTWVQERSQARKDRSRYEDDPHASSSKVPHSQRAFIFCQWLVKTFGVEYLNSGSGVLDIAGGKGEISIFLTHKYGIRSTVVEPKPRRDKRYHRRNLMDVIRKQLDIEAGGDGTFYKRHKMDTKATAEDEIGTVGTQLPSSTESIHIQNDSQIEHTTQVLDQADTTQKEEAEEKQSEEDAKQAMKKEHRRAKKLALEQFVVPRLDTLLDDAFVERFPGVLESCSVLIGMHPDQATEPIVTMALKHDKPFAVVPCCVFAIENPHRRLRDGSEVTTTAAFVQYLTEKDTLSRESLKAGQSPDLDPGSVLSCEPARRDFLPFDGTNQQQLEGVAAVGQDERQAENLGEIQEDTDSEMEDDEVEAEGGSEQVSSKTDPSQSRLKGLQAVTSMLLESLFVREKVTKNGIQRAAHAGTEFTEKECTVAAHLVDQLRPYVLKRVVIEDVQGTKGEGGSNITKRTKAPE